MKDRNIVVAALAGVLAGTVLGASTFAAAQVVSYSKDTHPSFSVERTKHDLHKADDADWRKAKPTVTRRMEKHGAAPAEAEVSDDACEGLSGRRKTLCEVLAKAGINYKRSTTRQ